MSKERVPAELPGKVQRRVSLSYMLLHEYNAGTLARRVPIVSVVDEPATCAAANEEGVSRRTGPGNAIEIALKDPARERRTFRADASCSAWRF